MKKIKQFLATILAVSAFIFPLALPMATVSAAADIQGSLCGGANLGTSSTSCDDPNSTSTIDSLISKIINIFSLVVGVVSVIMIIIGGFKYITSGGESAGVKGAKDTILYAIIGLVVVALAQVIVKFVLNKATTTG